jgi:hypothetical protein
MVISVIAGEAARPPVSKLLQFSKKIIERWMCRDSPVRVCTIKSAFIDDGYISSAVTWEDHATNPTYAEIPARVVAHLDVETIEHLDVETIEHLDVETIEHLDVETIEHLDELS